MNKLFYLILLLILFPGIIFAKANYARSIPDPLVPSVTVVEVTATDYDREINCGGLGFWGIQVVENETGKVFSASPRFVSSDTLDVAFTLDIPPGNYEEVTFTCSDDGENLAFQYGSLENDLAGDQIIFIASDAPSVTSDLDDGNIVTATIDGDALSTTSTTEITENLSEEIPPTAETETDLSQTAAVVEADSGILDTVVETVLDVIGVGSDEELTPVVETPTDGAVEESGATSSVTGDTNTNGTTTTTF